MNTQVYQRAVHVDYSTAEAPAKGPAQRRRGTELHVPRLGAHRCTSFVSDIWSQSQGRFSRQMCLVSRSPTLPAFVSWALAGGEHRLGRHIWGLAWGRWGWWELGVRKALEKDPRRKPASAHFLAKQSHHPPQTAPLGHHGIHKKQLLMSTDM